MFEGGGGDRQEEQGLEWSSGWRSKCHAERAAWWEAQHGGSDGEEVSPSDM